MAEIILPDTWRQDARISLAALARRLNVTGQNPSRTVERWLKGERKPPASAIAILEDISCGVVRAAGWAEARRRFTESAAAPQPDISGGARV